MINKSLVAIVLATTTVLGFENKATPAPIRITNTPTTDEGPRDMFGDWIVYESNENGYGIFLQNINTQEKRNLTNYFAEGGWIDGNYMGLESIVSGSYSHISLYNIQDNSFSDLTPNVDRNQFGVGISEGKVFWVDGQEENMGSLVVYDIASGNRQTYPEFNDSTLKIEGQIKPLAYSKDKVAFQALKYLPDTDTFVYSLNVFDLNTRTKETILEDSNSILGMGFDGDYLSYIRETETDYDIFLYNLKDNTTQKINQNSKNNFDLDMAGNMLVWNGWTSSNNRDIYYYDINEGIEKVLALPGSQELPIVWDNVIAYGDNLGGAYDVFVNRLSVPEPSSLLLGVGAGLLGLLSHGVSKAHTHK